MSRYKRSMGFEEVAQNLVRRIDKAGKRHSARAVLAWDEVAGPEISRHTRGFALRDDHELVVLVDSAPWAQQLSLMSSEFITRLDSVLGEGSVKSIRFTVSKNVGIPMAAPAEGDSPATEAQAVALDETERAQVAYLAAAIKDSELREVVTRVMVKDLEQKKGEREAPKERR